LSDQHHNYWFYNVCGRRQRKWFTSIPASIYWTIVTLTTVGYGDISPETPLGQFIASFVMILGYGIIAVPTGIVTAEIAKVPKIK
jgi:voltage-gated potassium channel